MRDYESQRPIILGLAGEACTGKTSVAEVIAPIARGNPTPDDRSIYWNHLYFALPLYEIVSIRRVTEGLQRRDRMLYGIHDILVQLFGGSPLYGAPPYDQLIEMTQTIVNTPVPPEGTKARAFMQLVGTDICRAYDPDCWINWMKRKANEEHRRFLDTELRERPHGIVVSDLRFPNEAQMVLDHPNGVLIKFTASPEIRQERARQRDGVVLDEEQAAHSSETSVNTIPEEWFHAIINTDDVTVAEQAALTLATIPSFLRFDEDAQSESDSARTDDGLTVALRREFTSEFGDYH